MNYHSTMHPASWFSERYRDGTLTLKPPFQRKPVWAARQKCSLVESILMRLPVPEIYVQQTTSSDGKTNYAIVDGQQRIRTILQFVGVETDQDEQEHNQFTLDKLPADSKWRNIKFSDLTDDEKKSFYGYPFVVRYLLTDSDDEVRDMFRRLNQFLTPLKPQELRNATYVGPFVSLAVKLADNEYWAENRIVSAASIRRMADVEFVSELLIGTLHGPQGGSAALIDDYYKQYEDYEDEFPDQKRAQRLFDDTLHLITNLLPDIKETRWSNKVDFYTLFVALASLLRTSEVAKSQVPVARKALNKFAKDIDLRLADEEAAVSKEVINYVSAVEKGVNDKKRRADRQNALLKIIGRYFKHTKKAA